MSCFRLPAFVVLLSAVSFIHADDKHEKTPPEGGALAKMTPQQLLNLWDKNKNGFVEKNEVPPRVQKVFDQFDRNGDGKLDQAELRNLLDSLKKRMASADAQKSTTENPAAAGEINRQVDGVLKRLDANGDGRISRAEAEGRPLAKAFDMLDRNKDGYLDRKELVGWVQRIGKAGPNKGEKGRIGSDFAAANNADDFDSHDKNADGRLTREELQGTKWADQFDKIDANRDGWIDRKEFENFLRQSNDSGKTDAAKDEKNKKK